MVHLEQGIITPYSLKDVQLCIYSPEREITPQTRSVSVGEKALIFAHFCSSNDGRESQIENDC